MSGFEVAGIILGALPILIPAIEHIRKSLSTKRYDQQLQSLIRNLKAERVKLQNVCEKLLDGLVPPSQIEAMISQPLGDPWRDNETARKIRTRLWDQGSYGAFEEAIQNIKESVDALAAKISAQKDAEASLLKRGIFALKRESYTELLADIKDSIASLVTLTSQSIELESSRRVRYHGRLFVMLQTLTRSLYRAIHSSLAACCYRHDIGLRLETRKTIITPLDTEDDIATQLEFRIAVSCDNGNNGSPWKDMLAVKAVAAPKTTPVVTSAAAPSVPSQKRSIRKRVGFGGLHSAPGTSTSTCTQVITMPCLPTSLLPAEVSLKLCGDLQAAQRAQPLARTGQPYGTIIDTPRKYAVHSTTAAGFCTWTTVSLRDALRGKGPSPLSWRDRFRIAVVVSSSVVQLHGSPWLSQTLTSGNIHLFVDAAGELALSCGDPILVQSLVPSTTPAGSSVVPMTEPASAAAAVAARRDPVLLSLGYLLLEILLGEQLEWFRAPVQAAAAAAATTVGCNNFSDYRTAQRALEKATFPSGNYRTAVSRCLEGELHRTGRGFASEDFCQEFYTGVVALLEKDFENA
ncbi:hypothetical protein MAPG_05171 [Magnaporthiopsis poae ATCC 64411]|uniref:DUF7580 domain-containing protein n=1 Tax=Magnaporthiopsis poae (strain ATCC 64411 / 73-15) TaxID=644358 RepID=A0A0C4DYP5_MAGP6|nr:hypothetical protein MAPG_05171 [Magnaporthiopsis poae ATCC 64411]